MVYSVLFGLVALLSPVKAELMCTSLDRLKGVVEGKMLPDSQMINLTMPGIMTCSRACLVRRRCKSLNFNMKTGECQLNSRTNDSTSEILRSNDDFVFSDIIHWPERLAGVCANHECHLNSYCNPVNKTHFVCKVTGCLDVPTVENGDVDNPPEESLIGAALVLKCYPGYMLNATVICQDDGTWSSAVCVSVSSCSMVKQYRPDSEDGEYWLRLTNFDNYTTKIYCNNMSTASPQEFLTLPNINYGIYPMISDENCDGVEMNGLVANCVGCGGEVWFNKIRVNITTMNVVRNDRTFANVTRQEKHLVYGTAFDCYSSQQQCEKKGKFTIDLKRTGWKVNENQEWETYGTSPLKMKIDKNMNGTVIILRCGGWAGGCKPKGGLFLEPFP